MRSRGETFRRRRRAALQQALHQFIESLEGRQLLSLLGVSPGFPNTFYNDGSDPSSDTYAYNSGTGQGTLTVNATADVEEYSNSSFDIITSGLLHVSFLVDSSGNVVPGQTGPNLILTGTAGSYGSPLLEGTISAFGFQYNGPSAPAQSFDFVFTSYSPTPGSLAPLFGDNDILMTLNSVNDASPNFDGSFTDNFQGVANGNVGPSPLPSPLVGGALLLTGLGVAHFVGKFRRAKAIEPS